ncbi:MAG: TraX family protein [Niameybacter sp.]|uniref:TraX family protein n=1 Tax=Niameybacter sp. TaxID=2033640 RepID=UPI002FC5CECD
METTISKETPKIQGNLDSNFLKLIAILAMTLDHVGKSLFPEMIILQIIGRLAFPIFAYCIVVGCLYTHDFKKYILRLGLFAIISQPIYALRVSMTFQEYLQNLGLWNIFFTLILGALAVKTLEQKKWMMFVGVLAIVSIFNFDYGISGVLLMVFFYLFRQKPLLSILVTGCMLATPFLSGGEFSLFGWMIDIQGFATLALIPIFCQTHFNVKVSKYFFYVYYPAHLLAIYLIGLFL